MAGTILTVTAVFKWCNYVWLQSILFTLQESNVYLLFLALILLGLKLAGVEPVAHWSWWWVLSPFALAALWWLWSDLSGRTTRLAAMADEQRKAERLAEAKKRLHSGGTKG